MAIHRGLTAHRRSGRFEPTRRVGLFGQLAQQYLFRQVSAVLPAAGMRSHGAVRARALSQATPGPRPSGSRWVPPMAIESRHRPTPEGPTQAHEGGMCGRGDSFCKSSTRPVLCNFMQVLEVAAPPPVPVAPRGRWPSLKGHRAARPTPPTRIPRSVRWPGKSGATPSARWGLPRLGARGSPQSTPGLKGGD